jgi:hypothetical protein
MWLPRRSETHSDLKWVGAEVEVEVEMEESVVLVLDVRGELLPAWLSKRRDVKDH